MPSGVTFPNVTLRRAWERGEYFRALAEPWTMQVLASLIVATASKHILELGTSQGYSTLWLAHAAAAVNGRVTTVDADPRSVASVQELCAHQGLTNVQAVTQEATAFLASQPANMYQFAFVDDWHNTTHVLRELELLRPLMRSPGLVAIHDLFNTPGLPEALQERHQPLLLPLQRCHVGDGLALLQLS